jgi:hypothetical protein
MFTGSQSRWTLVFKNYKSIPKRGWNPDFWDRVPPWGKEFRFLDRILPRELESPGGDGIYQKGMESLKWGVKFILYCLRKEIQVSQQCRAFAPAYRHVPKVQVALAHPQCPWQSHRLSPPCLPRYSETCPDRCGWH